MKLKNIKIKNRAFEHVDEALQQFFLVLAPFLLCDAQALQEHLSCTALGVTHWPRNSSQSCTPPCWLAWWLSGSTWLHLVLLTGVKQRLLNGVSDGVDEAWGSKFLLQNPSMLLLFFRSGRCRQKLLCRRGRSKPVFCSGGRHWRWGSCAANNSSGRALLGCRVLAGLQVVRGQLGVWRR